MIKNLLRKSVFAAAVVGATLIPHTYDELNGFTWPGYCSGYATRIAERGYRMHYEKGHAWNLRYHNQTINCQGKTLDEILAQAKPGHLLGIYLPSSSYNNEQDETGQLRAYTHIALYHGIENREPMILHNYVGARKDNLRTFLKRKNAVIKEIILPSNK